MNTLAQTWSVLSYSNLAATSHTFDLNMDWACLIYGIIMKMDMDLGNMISCQITQIAQSNSSRLDIPTLIMTFCDAKEVHSDTLTIESLNLVIKLAYIWKNWWNLTDTSVVSRETKKTQGKATQEVPPTPSPAPTPPATTPPSSQTSNLDDLILQSIHQGQLLLLQSLQQIGHSLQQPIMSIEEFLQCITGLED